MEQPIVIGHIDIDSISPVKIKHSSITCDDCGCHCDSSHGDSRIKITTFFTDKPNEVRMVCDWCADDNFGSHEPISIFE